MLRQKEVLPELKILKGLGLTDIDIKILQAEGENSVDIAKQTGMLVNVVELHKNNIFIRLGLKTLKEARQKFMTAQQKS